MLSRPAARMAVTTQRSAAMRRMRRRVMSDPYYCATNGCATHLVVDSTTGLATCPICGFRRRLS